MKLGNRIGITAQCGVQTSGVELRRGKVAAQMVAFGLVHCRIKLDQDLPGPDALSVTNMDSSYYPRLERLASFGAPARDGFSRRRAAAGARPQRAPSQ